MLRILLAGAFAVVSTALHADNISRNIEKRYRGDYADIGYYRWGPDYRPTIALSMNERAIIQRHYAVYFAKSRCPPGLARHDGECVPPGRAKRFVIGEALPGTNGLGSLPPELGARLVAPPGHVHVYLDGHVLLIAQSTRVVVDAISVDIARR